MPNSLWMRACAPWRRPRPCRAQPRRARSALLRIRRVEQRGVALLAELRDGRRLAFSICENAPTWTSQPLSTDAASLAAPWIFWIRWWALAREQVSLPVAGSPARPAPATAAGISVLGSTGTTQRILATLLFVPAPSRWQPAGDAGCCLVARRRLPASPRSGFVAVPPGATAAVASLVADDHSRERRKMTAVTTETTDHDAVRD